MNPWPEIPVTDPRLPIPLAFVDVDGDGDGDDLVSAEGRLAVYDGIPGGFAPARTLVRTEAGGAAWWTDLTGDGAPDVVHDSFVFVAEPSGAWRWTATIPFGFESPVPSDRDGDGLPELLGASWGLVAPGLLQEANLGAGVFGPPTNIVSFPSASDHLDLADLDGDGDQDLLRFGSYGVDWLRDDAGTFSAPIVVTSRATSDLRLADWTGDGDLDLVWATFTRLSVAENAGDGTFARARDVLATRDFLEALGDSDGDGRIDAVLGTTRGLAVALQRADGTLQAPIDRSAGRGRATSVGIADTDGDGDGDLFVTDAAGHAWAEQGPAGLVWHPLSGPALDGLEQVWPIEQPAGPPGLVVSEAGATFVNDGTGGFSPGPVMDLHSDPGGFVNAMAVVDVDGDGLDDLVLRTLRVGDPPLMWLRDDAGTLAPAAPLPCPQPDPNALVPGDADGDGDEDLLIVDAWSDDTGSSGATFGGEWLLLPERTFARGWREGDALVSSDTWVADLDGDGDADVVNATDTRSRIRENRGDGTLVTSQDVPGRVLGAADLDGDGRVDLVTRAAPGAAIGWRAATAPFAWGPEVAVTAGPDAFVLLADLDRDGTADLVTRDGTLGAVSLRRATGAGGFAPPEPILDRFVGAVRAADLDGDGDLDPYGVDGHDVVWWRNPAPAPEPRDSGTPTDTGAPPRPPDATATTGDTSATDPTPRPPPPDRGGCGCATGGAGWGWALVVAAGLARRQQR